MGCGLYRATWIFCDGLKIRVVGIHLKAKWQTVNEIVVLKDVVLKDVVVLLVGVKAHWVMRMYAHCYQREWPSCVTLNADVSAQWALTLDTCSKDSRRKSSQSSCKQPAHISEGCRRYKLNAHFDSPRKIILSLHSSNSTASSPYQFNLHQPLEGPFFRTSGIGLRHHPCQVRE